MEIQLERVSISRTKILFANLLLCGDNSVPLWLKESPTDIYTRGAASNPNLKEFRLPGSTWNISSWSFFKERHSPASRCFNQKLTFTILLQMNHCSSIVWWKILSSFCTKQLTVITFTPFSLSHFLTVGICVPGSFKRQTQKSPAIFLTKNIFGKYTALTWSVRISKTPWGVQQTYLKKSKGLIMNPFKTLRPFFKNMQSE